mgnify:CR=1 FL=1
MSKQDWIDLFRRKAEEAYLELSRSGKSQKDKAGEINKKIKAIRDLQVEQIKLKAGRETWSDEDLLHEILLLTYASYVVMLEYRNKIWEYEYMAFARRIGELWEPFCKLPFEFPVKKLAIIEPPNFDAVQEDIKKKTLDYISELDVTANERRMLTYYYNIPWGMVDSGGIKLALDLHFEQDNIRYNCDFKSGFSSNEKGNTNRLLLVASIYHSLGDNEKTYLFVRQNEDENNHYLQTLKNSPYWEVFCADDCYAAIKGFTGFDLREWLDTNVDWSHDISAELKDHLEANDLIKYLTW